MTSRRSLAHLGALAVIIGGCASENPPGGSTGTRSGGASGTAGVTGSNGGVTGTGGETSTGGVTSTGGAVGSGGRLGTGGGSDAMGTGGVGSGGRIGEGGQGGANTGGAGTAGSTGSGGGGMGLPLKNAPIPSAGCGKPTTITSSGGYKTITSSGDQRQYVITLPPNYDMNKPYRFIYMSHGQGGEGAKTMREGYYGFVDIPDAVNSSIFVAASGIGGIWQAKDVPLFDDILEFVKQGACVDTSRVFVLGFSFGGMYSYSLSMTRQKTIRAGIGMSPANYNITIPPKAHDPIAWMQSTGMSDHTCPWVSDEASMKGSKFIAIEHGTDNGCTVPNPIPTWTSGGMLCVDFAGCKAGFPVKVCTFNGPHAKPPGSPAWLWEFITQF